MFTYFNINWAIYIEVGICLCVCLVYGVKVAPGHVGKLSLPLPSVACAIMSCWDRDIEETRRERRGWEGREREIRQSHTDNIQTQTQIQTQTVSTSHPVAWHTVYHLDRLTMHPLQKSAPSSLTQEDHSHFLSSVFGLATHRCSDQEQCPPAQQLCQVLLHSDYVTTMSRDIVVTVVTSSLKTQQCPPAERLSHHTA